MCASHFDGKIFENGISRGIFVPRYYSIAKRSVGSVVRCYFLAGLSLAGFFTSLSLSSLCYQYLMGLWCGLNESICS